MTQKRGAMLYAFIFIVLTARRAFLAPVELELTKSKVHVFQRQRKLCKLASLSSYHFVQDGIQ